MDSSFMYMLLFIFSMLFSWYLNKEYFDNSSLQYNIFKFIDSGGAFSLYLFVILAMIGRILFAMIRTKSISSTSVIDIIVSFVFVIIGSVLFQFGFKRMSELQLICNIPRSKIRSVAVGIVEVSGRIVSKYLLTAPYSKSQCVYSQCELQEYRKFKDLDSTISYQWERVSSQMHKIPFWIKDETGQIMVDPDGAEVPAPIISGCPLILPEVEVTACELSKSQLMHAADCCTVQFKSEIA